MFVLQSNDQNFTLENSKIRNGSKFVDAVAMPSPATTEWQPQYVVRRISINATTFFINIMKSMEQLFLMQQWSSTTISSNHKKSYIKLNVVLNFLEDGRKS